MRLAMTRLVRVGSFIKELRFPLGTYEIKGQCRGSCGTQPWENVQVDFTKHKGVCS